MFRVPAFILLFTILYLGCSPSNALADTYDDCILNGLKGVSSDFIAKQIMASCKNKYSKTTSPAKIQLPKMSSIEVGDQTKWKVPVPAGNWEKTATRVHYGAGSPLVFEIWSDIENKQVKHLMYLYYSKHQNSNRWKRSKICDRVDFHFIKKISNKSGSRSECYLVNHWRFIGGSSKRPNLAANKVKTIAKEWYTSQGISIPRTVITANSIWQDYNLLNVRFAFNPEFDGFPPTVDSAWSSSDWHQDKITADEKRLSYIKKVTMFAEKMHEALKPQFKR